MHKTGSLLLLIVGILWIAAPLSAQPRFEMTLVPPLETPLGEMPFFLGWDMNDKGQVVGRASGSGGIAAARFSRGRGVEDLDPNGEYRSTGWSINAKGEVLGFVYGTGKALFDDIFVQSRRKGFDFLEQGKSDDIIGDFLPGFRTPGAFPRSGNVFGSAGVAGPGRLTPYIYTNRDGWTDLSDVHPRFAAESTFAAYTNDTGHLVFVLSGQTDDNPPTLRQEVFMRLPNGNVIALESPGKPNMPGSRPNKKGRMAGLYVTNDGKERAYVFTPQTGLVDIHPDGFSQSFALGTNNKGTVYGALKDGGPARDLFVHTDAGGVEVVATRAEFEDLAQGHQGTFQSIYPEDINKKDEVVGCVFMRKGPDFPFLYSPRHGLIDLSEVVEELDASVVATGCGPVINNKSQVLLGVEEDGERSTAAILKVVG